VLPIRADGVIDVNFAFDLERTFVLSAGKCAWFNAEPLVRVVRIRRADYTPPADSPFESAPVLCGLEAVDRSRWPRLTRWTYGHPVEGYRLIGPCTPLNPGSYRVDVGGSGAGSRIVTIGDDRR
jgi:hypothetical protein